MKLTTTELLDFFAKADKVAPLWRVKKSNGGYEIIVHFDWEDEEVYPQCLLVNDDSEPIKSGSDYCFDTMNTLLDQRLKEYEEIELKVQKRQELLSRLTDEEKKFLGVN